LAANGSGRKTDTETNVTFGNVVVVLGEAECAAMQTVQVAESAEAECWCAANAIADQRVSNKHKHAIFFDIGRMRASPWKLHLNLYQNWKGTQ
jgi:hypothetical protein